MKLPLDPYEEENQKEEQARLLTPEPARKSKKGVLAGLAILGLLLGMIILSNIAGLLKPKPQSATIRKPVTMTRQQSDSFAQQQAGEAAYLKGLDRDKNRQKAEDMLLGQASDSSGDAYAEADGMPSRTKAQDDAIRGGRVGSAPEAKSEAQLRRERAELEAEHRRQNDLDSSPVSLDFSDYFEREKAENAVAKKTTTNTKEAAQATAKPHSALADYLNRGENDGASLDEASSRNEPHDPKDDYQFDSSFGKLYRLIEASIIESVLVNRLTGAAAGPVIAMVTTDVYSESGAHLLIPKGTRLLGKVTAVASLNQERLFIAFHRMVMPDGYSISLDKFQGLDVVGQTGLRDLVNHHYVQIFGASLALAAISATAQVGNSSSYGTYNWSVQMRNGVSEGLSQSAQRVMERFLNVLPTFTIRERTRVKVMLSGDLLLPDVKNHTMDPDL